MNLMNTINETAKLCKEEGIGLSRNHIRYLANSGEIPSVKIGNKVLINWQRLLEHLNNSTLSSDEPESGIRKISS